MRAYNVEFFNRDLSFVTNQMVPDFVHQYDYLAQSNNVIILRTDHKIKTGQYIRITGAPKEVYGIVTAIDEGRKQTNVTFVPLTELLSVDVLFDTDYQGGSTSLEECLKTLITSTYITNPDTSQNIPWLVINTTSTTSSWGFNLKSTNEGMHHIIVNLWETILTKALMKYQVVVDMSLDFSTNRVVCTIGRVPDAIQTIEADLPNIINKNVVVGTSNAGANKAVMYNGENYAQTINYYLHPDGTYDTNNTDRVLPVSFVLRDVVPEEGQTFASAAASEASEVFGSADYDNLIELEMLVDDMLVNAGSIKIGQIVRVYSNGTPYQSILSGFIIDKTITLVFGIIRLDLTKQIRR